ncbi:MAG: flavin-containing monooxygenase [Gammaproteobacteria bacterium]
MTFPTNKKFAIIGAGMSGILAAIKLTEQGCKDVTVYEKADRLGGTWRDNTYPGLSCDVPSHHYTYTFEPNPDWTRQFAGGDEIYRYFERSAKKYRVSDKIVYEHEAVDARYEDGRWVLSFSNGNRVTVDIIIAATGVLHHPVTPNIPGLDDFAGAMFHSARWDHSVSLKGKKVGVIGTGSTGMQIVPAIIDEVEHLSLFQRTAQWVLDFANVDYSEEERAAFRENPQLMKELYDKWANQFTHSFSRAVIGGKDELKKIADLCKLNLETNVHDPELREKLRPDYVATCKRLVMSDQFYPAIQKPNASLVTSAIEKIEAGGVRTEDGKLHELDVLVLATGFNGHSYMRPMELIGRDGLRLSEVWQDSAEAYRSIGLPGFPNFFMMVGPNSPIGNFSVIMISEMQLSYIMQLIAHTADSGKQEVEPTEAATKRFNQAVKDAMKGTVWVTGCKSWYLDKNGNPTLWPWTFERYQEEMAAPEFADFSFN